MVPINLRMGQSTVLRFPEKPKKVILGNSNYYSVEFIDNDVALQPQGTIPTNLFVYGIKNVYGFLIRTGENGIYDDLVHVRWKDGSSQYPNTAVVKLMAIHEVSRPNINFNVGKRLAVNVSRVQRYERKEFYILDILLQNTSQSDLALSDFQLEAVRQKLRLSPQEFVLKDRIVRPAQTTTARLFLNVTNRKDFSINIKLKDGSYSQVIAGKFL